MGKVTYVGTDTIFVAGHGYSLLAYVISINGKPVKYNSLSSSSIYNLFKLI